MEALTYNHAYKKSTHTFKVVGAHTHTFGKLGQVHLRERTILQLKELQLHGARVLQYLETFQIDIWTNQFLVTICCTILCIRNAFIIL